MSNRYFGAFLLCFFSSVINAHHGLDFVSVQTAHLPEQGMAYAILRLDHISAEEDETEFEPAVLYAATDWLTLELHAHFEKAAGESTKFESFAPALHFRLTPREQPFSMGVSTEFEFARENDDEDAVELAAVFGYETTRWMASANVLFEKESGTSGKWGYATGIRRSFDRRHGVGVEVSGFFENSSESNFLLAYYGELSQRFSVNAAQD